MIGSKILPHLKRLLKISKYIHALPFEWNDATSKAIRTKSKNKLILHKWQLVVHLIYLTGLTVHLIIGHMSLSRKLQGAPFLLIHWICIGLRWNWDSDKGNIELINSLVDFEKTFPKRLQIQQTLLDKCFRLLLALAEISCWVVGLGIFVILMVDPCTPPFLTSAMSRSCSENSQRSSGLLIIFWLIIISLESYILLNSLLEALFYVMYSMFFGIVEILDILISKFSLDQAKESGRKEKLLMYRKVQLIEAMLNANVQGRILPVMFWLTPLMETCSLYICIKYHGNNDIPMSAFVIFILFYFDSILLNIILISVASFVFTRSQKVLEQLRRYSMVTNPRKSIITRMLRSCRYLRVKSGMNFIDQQTPIIIQNFCISQTASLLLISK